MRRGSLPRCLLSGSANEEFISPFLFLFNQVDLLMGERARDVKFKGWAFQPAKLELLHTLPKNKRAGIDHLKSEICQLEKREGFEEYRDFHLETFLGGIAHKSSNVVTSPALQ